MWLHRFSIVFLEVTSSAAFSVSDEVSGFGKAGIVVGLFDSKDCPEGSVSFTGSELKEECINLAADTALGYTWNGTTNSENCPKGCYVTASNLLHWNDDWYGGKSKSCQPICKAAGQNIVASNAPVTVAGSESAESILTVAIAPGATVLSVKAQSGFVVGREIIIDQGLPNEEVNKISGFGSILLNAPTAFAHSLGASVKMLKENHDSSYSSYSSSESSESSSGGEESFQTSNSLGSMNSFRNTGSSYSGMPSSDSDFSGSAHSSGFGHSGSSGLYLRFWQWIVACLCCVCCIAALAAGGFQARKRQKMMPYYDEEEYFYPQQMPGPVMQAPVQYLQPVTVVEQAPLTQAVATPSYAPLQPAISYSASARGPSPAAYAASPAAYMPVASTVSAVPMTGNYGYY